MADEKPGEILLTVDVDEAAVESRIVELRKQITGLLSDKEALNKANKAGTISADDYAKAMTRNKLSISETNKELRENERVLEKNTQQQKAAAGSINQMRAQVSLLYADYANLSKEERKNAEVGGVLKKTLKDLTDELKDEEEAVGDGRRSVGLYAEAIEGAISKNTNFVSTLTTIRSKLGEARDALKAQVQGYKDTTAGLGGAQKAAIGFGLSLKAIGIGLLITAISAVIGFLSKMDAGMDLVEQGSAALGAAFEVLIKAIAPIGEVIVNAFIHPIDSIKNLTEALSHPIDSFIKLRDAAMGIQGAMGEAARAAVEYTKAMQDIGDEQDGLISQQAKVNQQVSLALIASKDRSKSEKERIRLLDVAGKAEEKLSKDVLSLKQRELAALIAFQKKKGELQDDDRKQLQEAQAAAIDAETASKETEQKIQNRRAALIESEEAARKAAADKAKQAAKAAADEQVAAAERELVIAKQKGEDTLAIEEKIVRRRLIADAIGLEKSRQQRLLLTAKANAEIIELNVKHAQELAKQTFDLAQTQTSTRLVLAQKGSEEEFKLQKQQLENQLELDRATANATIKDKQQLKLKLRELDATFGVATEQLEDAFNKGQLDRQLDLNQKRLQTEINLGNQTFAVTLANQRKQLDLEEKYAIELLDLEEKTAKERGLFNDKLQSELLVKRNAIQAKGIADRRALDQQELEQEKANEVALAEARLAGTKEGTRNELEAQRDLLKKKLAQELANIKLTEEERVKIKAQFKQAEEKLDADFEAKTIEKIVSTVTLATSTLSTLYEAQSQALIAHLDKQQAAALVSAGANADLRARIEEQYQKKREKLEKDAAKKRQHIASIENLIATAQAGTEALKLFAKNPILGAITEALILTKALAQQAVIDSQQFADGGVAGYLSRYFSDGKGAYVRGPGTGKSDSINARISNGESIVNAKSTAMFYDQLSAINVAGGGRAFPGAMGGSEVPQLGGFAFGGVKVDTNADAITASILAGLKDANFVVSVTDIHKVEKDLDYAVAAGNI